MMQPAQYRSTIDVPCPLNSARYWRILLRLNNRQRIANAREKPIKANKNQAVDGAEGLFLRSGSPQNVYLLPQHPNFSLERCPRPKQICDHPNNEPDKISHPVTASPDSRLTASQMRFPTGAASGRGRSRGRSPGRSGRARARRSCSSAGRSRRRRGGAARRSAAWRRSGRSCWCRPRRGQPARPRWASRPARACRRSSSATS